MFALPFFALAAVSPGRQKSFRVLAAAHVGLLGFFLAGLSLGPSTSPVLLGQFLLVAGIVEGALLVGWRLTQLPKSQALEFLLVSPLRPHRVFIAEALVGLTRLALVTLSGLPLLLLMCSEAILVAADLPTLLLVPFLWGGVTGLLLAQYAFEPPSVRRWGERILVVLVVLYLVIGVLAGENLRHWLQAMPGWFAQSFLDLFQGFHEYNPFGVMKFALEHPPQWAVSRVVWVSGLAVVLACVLLVRAAWRLQGHFQDEHYRPVLAKQNEKRPAVGDQPLTWWAVKRVSKFSGRINLWLAGGFATLYTAYMLFESVWPPWMGRQVFEIFNRMGGMPTLATSLVLLAAVPAAFQYGLWDSNIPDRCRRLELLLLTRLDGPAYWHASVSAAWNRGRGYFFFALLLWWGGLMIGALSLLQFLACLAAGILLWSLYFTLGFWAFSKGSQANLLGMTLTLVLPAATVMLHQNGYAFLAALLPPGLVHHVASVPLDWPRWTLCQPGFLIGIVLTLGLAKDALARCDAALRRWFDAHQGIKAE